MRAEIDQLADRPDRRAADQRPVGRRWRADRRMGALHIGLALSRTRTAARAGRRSSRAGPAASRVPGATQQAFEVRPIRFSRIQIAWCVGCWPTSPRPHGPLPAVTHHRCPARPRAGPNVRYRRDLLSWTGTSRQCSSGSPSRCGATTTPPPRQRSQRPRSGIPVSPAGCCRAPSLGLGCPRPSGLRILIGCSAERTGSRAREI